MRIFFKLTAVALLLTLPISALALDVPQPFEPNDGEVLELNTTATFSWNKVSGATKYQIVFGFDDSFSSFDAKKNKCTERNTCATFTVNKIFYKLPKTHAFMKDVKEGSYYWKVRSYKGTKKSAFSEVYSFRVGDPKPPEPPTSESGEDEFVVPKETGTLFQYDDSDAVFFTNSDEKPFSYTKIANDGSELPKTAKLGTGAKEWACTKDNNTGLIWEVKTDDSRLRDKDWNYSWYEPDASKNGGSEGYKNYQPESCKGSECDTYAFTNAVNKQGLCGAKDWQVPKVQEISALFVCPTYFLYTTYGPIGSISCAGFSVPSAINTTYFPDMKNMRSLAFWSSSPDSLPSLAWSIGFGSANVNWEYKNEPLHVRLVRGGQ